MSQAIFSPKQLKDSLISEIRNDWQVYQLGEIIEGVIDFRGKTPKKIGMEWGGGEIPALSANNVEMGRINFDKETYYGSEKLYKKWMNKGDVEKGDIIMTMEAPLGNIAQIPDNRKYILSQRVLLLKTNKYLVFNGFLKYYLMSDWFQSSLRKKSTGTTATGIQQARLIRLFVKLPPLPEQQLIAEILDTVNEAIARTSSLIAKLKQMKAGLLHDLLTRGLDENGQLRDAIAHPEQFKNSLLGQIPKEWEISTIGSQASTSSGSTPSRSNASYWQDGIIPWVKTGEVNYTVIQYTEEKITQKALNETSLTIYPVGTVLVAMYGQGVTRGKVGTLGIEATTNQACAAIVAKDDVLISRYLFHYLTYHYDDIRSVSHGSHQSNLNEHLIASYCIRLPPIREQNRIIEILDTHDTRIRAEEIYCDKLKLQKRGLMQDLLTGKVRVQRC